MLKKLSPLIVVGIYQLYGTANASLPDCVGNQLSMQGANEEICISTCSAIADYPDAQLRNTDGFCVGDATVSKFTLYEVKLGVSSQVEPTCDLWSGDFVIDKAGFAAGDEIDASGSFGYCEPGTYDVVFLTTSRIEVIAGQTVFPDGSDKVVKTSSDFASDNFTDHTDTAAWLETGTNHSNDALPYIRLSEDWSNNYKKIASTPSDEDMSSRTISEMEFDWTKLLELGYEKDTLATGWYCEDSSNEVCERVLDSERSQIRINSAVTDVVNFPDGGLVVTETVQPNWNISYFGLSGELERGLRFLWTHDDVNGLRYHGVNAGESGIQVTITPIEVGNP